MENPNQPEYQSPQPEAPQPPTPPIQPVVPTQPLQPIEPTEQHDPGKTLGIVGFIFAFVGLQLVGLILSIIGFHNSKKAGFKNTLAFAGIILNAIFLGLIVLSIGFLIALTSSSYNGISNRANSSSSLASASSVIKWSELYNSDNGTYPTTLSQINKDSTISASPTPFLFEPASPTVVEFYSCGNTGNKVGYYDYNEKDVLYLYSGEVDETTNCTLSKS